MSSSKRPSTSSLRRFLTSRPYVPVAEIRRRFGIDDPDCMCSVKRDGQSAFVGLPEREALKIQDLWSRGEIGLELSVEVRAPVVVGIYPMRIARYAMEAANGHQPNGHVPSGPRAEVQLPPAPREEVGSHSGSASHDVPVGQPGVFSRRAL
jgi:hypothetical protein